MILMWSNLIFLDVTMFFSWSFIGFFTVGRRPMGKGGFMLPISLLSIEVSLARIRFRFFAIFTVSGSEFL